MEFLTIEDPSRRKELVQEYIATRKAIRARNENTKENNLISERALEERVRPIVEATNKLPEKFSNVLAENSIKSPFKNKPFHQSAFDYYMSNGMNKVRDNYFRIFEVNGSLNLGDQPITIDEDNNIIILGHKFEATPGLWDLIMLNDPKKFTEDDLEQYRKINDLTNLYYNPRVTAKASHKKTNKWKFLNERIERYPPVQRYPAPPPNRGNNLIDYDDYSDDSSVYFDGLGVTPIIIPSDIKSLKSRLQLVCAERAAGNVRATTNEIVAILDEMLRQNHITRPEYNVVCEKLGC